MANPGEAGGTSERSQPDSNDRTQPTRVPDRQPPEGDDKRDYGNVREKSKTQTPR